MLEIRFPLGATLKGFGSRPNGHVINVTKHTQDIKMLTVRSRVIQNTE